MVVRGEGRLVSESRLYTSGVKITLNGEEIDAPEPGGPGIGPTVAELLAWRGVKSAACAVEVNRELAPRRTHGERRLVEGDRVEIVTLVGGG